MVSPFVVWLLLKGYQTYRFLKLQKQCYTNCPTDPNDGSFLNIVVINNGNASGIPDGSAILSVEFDVGVTREENINPIPASGDPNINFTEVLIPIPTSCLTGGCGFTAKIEADFFEEFLSNNVVGGNCIF